MVRLKSEDFDVEVDPYVEEKMLYDHFDSIADTMAKQTEGIVYIHLKEEQRRKIKEGLSGSISTIIKNRAIEPLTSILERALKNDLTVDFSQTSFVEESYLSKEKDVVEQVIEGELDQIEYPSRGALAPVREAFEEGTELSYDPKLRVAIVERELPPPTSIPKRKEVKYIKSRDSFEPVELSEREFEEIYESMQYQLSLRTIYEILMLDNLAGDVIDSVVFNGWVATVNPATGREKTSCTVSVQASKDKMMELNLSQVDPEAAFKELGGSSASPLKSKSSVVPIMRGDSSDSQFLGSRSVGEESKEVRNIAAMEWEEFEHLIGDLFEKEFSEQGGEVNVTQASQDGGIDAVAYDPDPLRGGKFVIQAKRYTRVVGVSAVRDLYGTAMSEGANKGILVTTSHFSPSAYDFAQDKPVQLLNGDDLLRLLDRHGYGARIDLEEARSQTKG